MMAFRPQLVPTLLFIPGVILLLGLGVWQVYRLQWKEGLIDEIETRLAARPVEIPSQFDDLESLQYQRVQAEGAYLHDQELLLQGQYFKGQLGARLLTPMRLEDGRILLVDRGWVPREMKEQQQRPQTLVEGEQAVEGILRRSWQPGPFTPENDTEENYWFYVDLKEAEKVTGLALLPMYLEVLDSRNPGGYPLTGSVNVKLRNDHLQYAITWFALAIAFTVIYVLYSRGRGQDRSD